MATLNRKQLVIAFREAIKYRKESLKKYPNLNTAELYYMIGYVSSMLYKIEKQRNRFSNDCRKES